MGEYKHLSSYGQIYISEGNTLVIMFSFIFLDKYLQNTSRNTKKITISKISLKNALKCKWVSYLTLTAGKCPHPEWIEQLVPNSVDSLIRY